MDRLSIVERYGIPASAWQAGHDVGKRQCLTSMERLVVGTHGFDQIPEENSNGKSQRFVYRQLRMTHEKEST